jgi:hypothetical protein
MCVATMLGFCLRKVESRKLRRAEDRYAGENTPV